MPVYKDEKRGTWLVKFSYKDWTGAKKYKTKRGFKKKSLATQWELDFKARLKGEINMAFGNFIEIYKEERYPRLKESTRLKKNNIIDNRILPYFINKNINEISPADIIKWQNTLIEYVNPNTNKKYAKSYLRMVNCELNAIFNHACRFYSLQKNPVTIAGTMGSKKDVRVNFWTLDEYKKFSGVMKDDLVHYYAFQILYWTGIREGELLALTKSDIDMENKTLSITKTYHMLQGREVITSPKTDKSNRIVSLSDNLLEDIQEYLDMYDFDDNDRIFSSTSKSQLYRAIKSGARKAKIKEIRVHDLRHSHVSLLINMGYTAVAIAERLGHESIHITYRYAHMFPSVQTNIADKLNELMEVG